MSFQDDDSDEEIASVSAETAAASDVPVPLQRIDSKVSMSSVNSITHSYEWVEYTAKLSLLLYDV